MNGQFGLAPLHGGLSSSTLEVNEFQREARPSQDEWELKVAALESLPSVQSKKCVVVSGPDGDPRLVKLRTITYRPSTREGLLKAVLQGRDEVSDETQTILNAVRARFDRAGVPMADVVVRFKGLTLTGAVSVQQPRSFGTRQRISSAVGGAVEHLKYNISGRPSGRIREVTVLDRVSSVLHPGRLTLLLGPPGSGKTMLMKALCGQIKGARSLRVLYDELSYNGLPHSKFVVERTAAYVSQVDQHFGELTVRETLDFAAFCLTSRRRKAAEVRLEERELQLGITPDPTIASYMNALAKAGRQSLSTEIALRALGLEGCADTLVGNAMLRGISGGQKKRVTTGEMFVGPAKVLFLDEISTGLDSATTLDICTRLRALSHTTSATILCSLLQPSPEAFNVFDDVMVLSNGTLVYHGPVDFVMPFFESVGFKCPVGKGTADFLQEVTTAGEQQLYWAGEGPYEYVPEWRLEAAYRATEPGARFLKELEEPAERGKDGHEELAKNKFAQARLTLFKANIRRQALLFWRNSAFIIIRIVQCTLMGLAVGTLFLQEDKETLEDAQMFMSVAFFSTMTQVVVSFAAPGLFIERLPVYFKQRNARFYPGWAFALPEILLQVPLIFAEASIWTLLVYFMAGFVTSVRFMVFWGFMFVNGLFGLSLFMMLAAVARQIPVANALQNLCIMVFTIASGYIINSRDLPKVWKGVYWANPVSWFVRGLIVNEFQSSDWGGPSPNPNLTLGEFYMTERGYQTGQYWVWTGMFAWAIGGTIINCTILSLACAYLSLPTKRIVVPTEEIESRSREGSRAGSRSETPAKDSSRTIVAVRCDLEEGGLPAEQAKPKASSSSSLPFKPVTLTFEDIKYSVSLPGASQSGQESSGPHAGQLLLLRGISGCFRPGVLTALMGASGAGKSTLMDVLALRKTGGTITGSVRINGFPQRAETFNRVMGYVEQTDIHVPESTVHEALLFSARLRLPSSVGSQATADFVEQMMDVVELGWLRDARVGMPGLSGLSVEQRKRLTIAVELVANPSIVFMDEPTSGLDARAAAVVMRAVRRISSLGRTVVCTIHQPSAEIFLAFDELLLLKRGGETIFAGPLGPGGANLVKYLEAIPGVAPFKKGQNPADWMLEVTSPAAEAERKADFAGIYSQSALSSSNAEQVQAASKAPEGESDLDLKALAPVSAFVQTKELLRRNFQQYSRLNEYNVMRTVVTLVIGILFGTVSDGKGDNTNNFNGVYNIVGVQYSSVMFLGILNAMCIQAIISLRRTVFYRERAAGIYSVAPYAAAEFLVELPCLIVQGIAYSLLVYWMIGFERDAAKFFWFLLIMVLTLCNWTFFGIQSVHITPSLILANAFTSFIFSLWDLFCGFYKAQSRIGRGWIWLYWCNPISYTLYGLVVEELGGVTAIMEDLQPPVSVAEFVRNYFGYKSEFRGWIVLVLCGFSMLWFATTFVALRYVKWQNR